MTIQSRLAEEKLTQSGLESSLWKAADILRGAVRPEKYGDYMLPLLFFKRLSDVWIEEYEQALRKYKDPAAAKQKFVHRFIIPDGCLWGELLGGA
jgi:type I restriction enzyme M protein